MKSQEKEEGGGNPSSETHVFNPSPAHLMDLSALFFWHCLQKEGKVNKVAAGAAGAGLNLV